MQTKRKARGSTPKAAQSRFGIGEWYGVPFASLTAAERSKFAEIQALPKFKQPSLGCPFQEKAACNKPGGVCSLRLYEKSRETGEVTVATGEPGELRTVCPLRFEQDQTIYTWVGDTVLRCAEPLVLREIGFLESPLAPEAEAIPSDVGRIDKVLVVPDGKPLSWCALEVQAVYFQGRAMRFDFGIPYA